MPESKWILESVIAASLKDPNTGVPFVYNYGMYRCADCNQMIRWGMDEKAMPQQCLNPKCLTNTKN